MKFQERQEQTFIQQIQNALQISPTITLVGSHNITIPDICQAKKIRKTNKFGKESLADILLTNSKNRQIRLSLKGTLSPSLGGGGLTGIHHLCPELTHKFFNTAKEVLEQKQFQYQEIPNIISKLTRVKDRELLVSGNENLGGPVDYLYVGPINLTSQLVGNQLFLDGRFWKPRDYVRDPYAGKNLYLRLRARRSKQVFDPTEIHPEFQLPIIYSRYKNDIGGRLVVTDTISSASIQIKT